MTAASIAAWIFAAVLAVLVLFQLALAAGAPWGALAMGGRFPGKFPPALRIAALVQVAIYGLMGAIVFVRTRLALPEWLEVSRIAIWFVVGVSALAVVLNLVTPSKWERRVWAPVAILMFAGVAQGRASGLGMRRLEIVGAISRHRRQSTHDSFKHHRSAGLAAGRS